MDDINLDKDAFITFCESLASLKKLSNLYIVILNIFL